MKKSLLLVLAALLALMPLASCESDTPADEVYVTVANGDLLLAYDAVTLSDADGDGTLTVNDALYLAHEENFEGGAAAGYASEMTDYGMSLVNLWGICEYGSYGYAVNNVPAISLSDEIAAGDHIVAYAYTDLAGWSDAYSYFDAVTAEAAAGEVFTLTLMMNSFDESFATVTVPVAGAVITIDGEATEYITDADGKVTLTVSEDAVISAYSEDTVLVPPVCVVRVG